MLIDLIAGARPNFVKLAPVVEAIQNHQNKGKDIHYRIIHTGQHYDYEMSQSFFEQLGIPAPNVHLNSKSGSHAVQTGSIMVEYEKILSDRKPDLCMVFGDVNSTLACAITAKKMHVDVAHVEAGIRSGDREMPEEINRIVTDSICDYFFTTSQKANELLKKTGIPDEKIFFVGNTMIDTLLKQKSRFKKPSTDVLEDDILEKNYIVLTLHRPKNVDQEHQLKIFLEEILKCSQDLPIIFPAHPRTKKILEKLNISDQRLTLTKPLGYLEFNYLVSNSFAVITDSGGITEETTVMGIPCMTLRDSTERPETVEIGTNKLLGTDPANIKPAFDKLFAGEWKKGSIPERWDGKAAERIVQTLLQQDE